MVDRKNLLLQKLTIAVACSLYPCSVFAWDFVEIARGTAPLDPRQPQLAVDGDGAIHLVYGVGDSVHYRRSDDGGQTYRGPVEIQFERVMSLGRRRGPRLAATRDTICVTAIGGPKGKGRDGDLLALRSVDGGITWLGPVRVNDVADAAREGLHAMASGPKGELCCAWLDLRHGGTEIVSSMSFDGGESWGQNVVVYTSPDGSVCECCHPSIVFDQRGRIHIQWRNSLDGNRDLYVSTSADNGKSFGPAVKLGSGAWKLDACPMDGGAIAAGGDVVWSAWRRGDSVYFSILGNSHERLLGAGEQPWITASSRGPFVVWLEKRGGEVYLLRPGEQSPVTIATDATDPVVSSAQDGGPVVVAWESHDGEISTLRCEVVAPKHSSSK